MLPIPFALAGAFEVFAVLAENVFPESLPLGGSHTAQLGFFFGGAFVFSEVAAIVKRLFLHKPVKPGRHRS